MPVPVPQEEIMLNESQTKTRRIVKRLNGVADKIIPPRQFISNQSPEEKVLKLIQGKATLSDDERSQIELLIKEQPILDNQREQFWNACTGIAAYKTNYCNYYYDTMQVAIEYQKIQKYPNPYFDQMKKDLNRTNQEDPFYTTEVKDSLERILAAYIWRNPTVGYIQGFNFLMFRIRKVLSEEDTFWTMVQIVETYMPPDYYVEMYGVKTQASILYKIFTQYSFLPEVLRKFDQLEPPFNLIDNSISWFVTIFTESLPEEASLKVLDLFFLCGQKSNKIIFDVTLGYLKVLEKQILGCDDICELKQNVFTAKNAIFKDTDNLLAQIYSSMNQLKQQHIDFYRPVCQKEAFDDANANKYQKYTRIKKLRSNFKENPEDSKRQLQRMFIEGFQLFPGGVTEKLNKSRSDPLNFFKCNEKWPLCAFNFVKKHVIPEHFTFKAEDYTEVEIYDKYFSVSNLQKNSSSRAKVTSTVNILLERNYHYCKINLFQNSLASLYVSKKKQEKLFKCKHLAIKKNMTEIEAHRKMLKFCTFVKSQDLSARERLTQQPLTVLKEGQRGGRPQQQSNHLPSIDEAPLRFKNNRVESNTLREERPLMQSGSDRYQMEFEEDKQNMNDITARRASGDLSITNYTASSLTWSDSSSDSSDQTIGIQTLLKVTRSKSHCDSRYWPSRKTVIAKAKFMYLPRNVVSREDQTHIVSASQVVGRQVQRAQQSTIPNKQTCLRRTRYSMDLTKQDRQFRQQKRNLQAVKLRSAQGLDKEKLQLRRSLLQAIIVNYDPLRPVDEYIDEIKKADSNLKVLFEQEDTGVQQ